MATRTSPTFRRRRLARRVRQLREQAGLTQGEAATGLDMSTSALSRKETGEVGTSVHEVRSMMDLYDIYSGAARPRQGSESDAMVARIRNQGPRLSRA